MYTSGINLSRNWERDYCISIASLGHTSIHAPHSVQVSGSTTATSFSSIAPTGHSSTQVPQAVHISGSTTAGKFNTSF